MTKRTFENMNSLQELIVSLAMAKSDAEFDGHKWEALGRSARNRYAERSKLTLQIAKQTYEKLTCVDI